MEYFIKHSFKKKKFNFPKANIEINRINITLNTFDQSRIYLSR